MLKRTYENQVCSVAWTLEVVGERWTLLIVRDAVLGVARFAEFRSRLGIAASVLALRLDRLVRTGVLERVQYHARPVRYEYRLTPKGRQLALVVFALMRWGDRYLAGEAGPLYATHHQGCGGQVEHQLVCLGCRNEVGPDQVTTHRRTNRQRQPQR